MLIRNFIRKPDSIDDIRNITERRRFVIIYTYPDGPHHTIYEVYKDNLYDLYVINSSTVVGSDYIIPKGIVVQYKNTYRGRVINPFIGGQFNLDAPCIFNDCSYSTRIVNGRDLLRFNKKQLLTNNTLEQFIEKTVKNDVLSPIPIYYNVEDQAHLAVPDYQLLNFEYAINKAPNQFRLNDFRDIKTTFISLNIHDDNLFQNTKFIGNYINPRHLEEYTYMVDIIRDVFVSTFLECFELVMNSIFATANIIMDIESSIASIHKESLRLKHSYQITSEEITKEYVYLIENLENISSNLFDALSVESIGPYLYQTDTLPLRASFHISPTINKIRLSSPGINKFYHNGIPPVTKSEYSSSDAEESSLAREFGESMYLSDYQYDNPAGL